MYSTIAVLTCTILCCPHTHVYVPVLIQDVAVLSVRANHGHYHTEKPRNCEKMYFEVIKNVTVSYTHLTLPTICSV